MDNEAHTLSSALEGAGTDLVLAVSGAGVSAASGIPTFRGSEPDAVWRQHDVELATFAYFLRDPVGQWSWYLKRFDMIADARPNPSHYALVALEHWQVDRGGDFLLVTQNIDTLHEQAGSSHLVKVHGSSDRVRCSRVGCRYGAPSGSLPRSEVDLQTFRAEPTTDNVPRCPECGALLRAHVLFFDEYYFEHEDYRFGEVEQALERMALALFVGTSFSVGVTELVLRTALLRRVPVFSIDPGAGVAGTLPGLQQIRARAEELLPQVCHELGAQLPPGASS